MGGLPVAVNKNLDRSSQQLPVAGSGSTPLGGVKVDGTTIKIDPTTGIISTVAGGSLELETNGTPNALQTLLNLIAGTGIHLVADGAGGVTISSLGGAAPWLTITNPTLTTFAWRNQGAASVVNNANDIYLSVPQSGTFNLNGREVAAQAAPFSCTAGLTGMIAGGHFSRCGVYVTDGTKCVVMQIMTNADTVDLQVDQFTDFSGSGNTTEKQVAWAFAPVPLFFKIFDDGTNLNFEYSSNGVNFITVHSQARLSFLSAITGFGFCISAFDSSVPAGVDLVSWAEGNS